MTFMISFGQWGGFYIRYGHTFRICLGFIALTFVPQDIDHLLQMNKCYQGLIDALGVETISDLMLKGKQGGDRNA